MSLITIDQEKCNQDGICVAECPARIIQLDSKEDYPTPGCLLEMRPLRNRLPHGGPESRLVEPRRL
jgi:ferredoxin